MKRILKYIFVMTIALVSLSACNREYLDARPETTLPIEVVFDTRDRIVAQVNGMYAAFRSGQYLGGRFQVYNDIRSNDFINRQANGVTGLFTWNHGLAASTAEVQNLWDSIYHAINRTNLFIAGIEEADPVTKGIITQAEYDQFRGEALALRALGHFHVAMLYAWPYSHNPDAPGVVLRTVPNVLSGQNNMARASLRETYRQILDDLNAAEALLPVIAPGTPNSAATVTRLHRNSVIALKTKVYLHMRDWPNVIAEANKIVPLTAPFNAISGVSNGLNPTFESIFRPPYTTRESLFSMPFTASELPGTQNGLAHYFTMGPVGGNEYSLNTRVLANHPAPIWANTTFAATDARRLMVSGTGVDLYLTKFPNFPHSDWAPVMRWSEVLLNLAEAEAMVSWTAGSSRAVALLNAVYRRSNPTADDLEVDDFADRAAFLDRLWLERHLEFLGEGRVSMDLMRRRATIARKFSGTTGAAFVDSVAITTIQYVWPIPLNEMNTNTIIQLNNVVPAANLVP